MKRIITLLLLLTICKYATAQLSYDNETFSYNGFNVNHYGLWWYSDPAASSFGPMAYFSAYGGIKFFSMGAPRAVLDVNGYLGVGTMNPNGRLDVIGAVLLPGSSSNTMTRPAVGATRITGEIAGYSGTGLAADDGFLRLSAGGGTNTVAKTFIDLSGYSTIPDLNRNIVFGTLGTERMRIDISGNVGIGTATPSSVGNYGVLALNGRSSSQGGYLSLMTNGTETAAIAANTQLNINAVSGIVTQFYTGSTPTLQISSGGNVLIGQISQVNTGYKLDVNGSIRSNAVVVNTSGADFVFNRNYHLNSLGELERYIEKNHHLPEIKSAQEMQKEGMNIGELNTKLLQKVEELTLYLIDKDKQVQQQQMQLSKQQQINLSLQEEIDELKKQLKGITQSLNKN